MYFLVKLKRISVVVSKVVNFVFLFIEKHKSQHGKTARLSQDKRGMCIITLIVVLDKIFNTVCQYHYR